MKKIALTSLLLVIGVGSAFAQVNSVNPTQQAGQNLLGLVDLMQVLVTRIVPLLIGATVVSFFFMMIKYMFEKDGDAKGKMWHYMMYAVVVLFVEVSIWGLVAFLGRATGVTQGGAAIIPSIPVGVKTYNPALCQTLSDGTQICPNTP